MDAAGAAGTFGVVFSTAFCDAEAPVRFTAADAFCPLADRLRFLPEFFALRPAEPRRTFLDRADRGVKLTFRLERPLGPAAAFVGDLDSGTPDTAVKDARLADPLLAVRCFALDDATGVEVVGGTADFALLPLDLRDACFEELAAFVAVGTFAAAGFVVLKRTLRASPRVTFRGGFALTDFADAWAVTMDVGAAPAVVKARAAPIAISQIGFIARPPPHRPATIAEW